MSKRLEKYIEDKIGIVESDVNPNKAINDLFGVEEKPLKFSTQSTMVPDEDFPVGKLREKETEIKSEGGKGKKTFYGLSTTGNAATTAIKAGAERGEIIPPDEAKRFGIDDEIQSTRPKIEKGLPAGFTFPEPKKGEDFIKYYNRVKTALPEATNMIALQNEIAKQYAMRLPEYKTIYKNTELIERGVFDFDGGETIKGFKVPTRSNEGLKKIVTETLQKNENYITKEAGESIDKAIAEYVDSIPQKDFDRFAVQLIGEVDPLTNKPYTRTKIKKLLSDRVVFAASKYFNQAVTPEIIDEVMTSLMGSQSAVNVKALADQKFKIIAPKKIGAFTAALTAIIKSGNASDLLAGGSKLALPAVGVGLELIFPNKAEAAELFTKDEISDQQIAAKFDGIQGLRKKQDEQLLAKNQPREEVEDIDIYERIGEPGFLEYFFSAGKARLNK